MIDYINAKPRPLALYVFSKDRDVIDQVLSETSAGDTCINHNLLHFLQMKLPFGGVNNSGIGKSHGDWGFKAFSHERSVLRDYFNATYLLFPPYTATKKKLIKLAGKWLTRTRQNCRLCFTHKT